MPDPKDSAKDSGDFHPADLEFDRDSRAGQPGAPGAHGDADRADQQDEARPGKGINQAGYLKDKDAPGLGKQGGKSS
jgi:hypothetical protein